MRAQPLAPSPSVSPSRSCRRFRAGYRTRLVPLLALLACVTRVPSFTRPLWNPDEGYLAVQARLLAQGGALYETVVDRKPPLVPWLYQGAFAVAGSESLTPVRILAVLAQLATALALASLARRRWGDAAGRTAGALYLLISVGLNPEDAQAAGFELFILPGTAAALWCADRRRWGAAGLAAGCAFLAKQTGGAVLLPVLWLCGVRGGGRGGVLRLTAGAAAPVLGAALATDPGGFLFWTVTGSGSYASLGGSGAHALGRGLANAALVAVACAGLIPPLARALRAGREGARGPDGGRATADLWLWLAASGGAVAVGLHFFGHYYLQLLPPLALLAAGALHGGPAHRRTAALRTSACCCVLFLAWGLLAPRTELDHVRRLAGTVAGRTGPGDRVLVWGMHPETYWLADRAPATRYLTAGLLTNYSGGRDGSRVGETYAVEGAWEVFRREMATRPPVLVVDDSRGKPYGPPRVPGLRRLLDAGYVRAGTVDGAVLYVRGTGGR
ncbi:glycosyltransferase [Streptomyces sp. PRKS01-65]|nr:glycosyltransferase family 39 protein [Streptomyces harenosi]NEY33072.1 glycosyltransferase [Streptomyces harenosi]